MTTTILLVIAFLNDCQFFINFFGRLTSRLEKIADHFVTDSGNTNSLALPPQLDVKTVSYHLTIHLLIVNFVSLTRCDLYFLLLIRKHLNLRARLNHSVVAAAEEEEGADQ